jgi:hypothetical protein
MYRSVHMLMAVLSFHYGAMLMNKSLDGCMMSLKRRYYTQRFSKMTCNVYELIGNLIGTRQRVALQIVVENCPV